MSHGPETLLDCADGPLNFTNVAISGNDIEVDGGKNVTDALEFVVPVYVGNSKTALLIKMDDAFEFSLNSGSGAIRDSGDGAILVNVTGNSVEETMVLNEKKISAERDVGMVIQNG